MENEVFNSEFVFDQSTWNFMQFLLVFAGASVQKFKVIFWVVQKIEISIYSALKPARISETVITELSRVTPSILNITVKSLLTWYSLNASSSAIPVLIETRTSFKVGWWTDYNAHLSLSVAQVTHCIVNSVCNSTTWNTRTESNKKRP